VGIFVNLSRTQRFFCVGDGVDDERGFETRVGNPLFLGVSNDDPLLANRIVSSPVSFWLIRRGRGPSGWLDADEPALPAPVLKLHKACNQRVKRVVAASPDVFARLMLGAALTDQNRARVNELPPKAFHAEPLPVGITAVR
jgi:hypothetical protein